MSRWRDIQKDLIEKSIHNEKLDIVEENISIGRIQGTTYYKKNTTPIKGILLVHGISRNRYSMGILAERLAEYGYFCLSIDLPEHFLNVKTFTMGELSETVTEGVLLLKTRYGMNKVAVIGHSIGAIGCLFSNAGYNMEIEQNIFSLWKKLSELIEMEEKLLVNNDTTYAIKINEKIKLIYFELKNLILISLKKGIQEHANVSCYVFLAPPDNCKTALPGISLLKLLNHKWKKRIIETLFHDPQVKRIYRDGNPVGYVPENKDEYTYWQFFKTTNDAEFVKYLADMKEPTDFLTLVEGLSRFQHKDDSVKFFEYYKNKYLLPKPKLFIYGMRDLFLRPFTSFAAKKLEHFYESCGNAEIHRESFSHVMMNNPKQQFSTLAIDNDKVTELIIKFLDKNF